MEGNAMRSEEITFDSDGCTLAGTYVEADRPAAAALLITGSGRVDRDSDARLAGRTLRAGITKAIADALAAANVSTLRYDKRGVGASGGDYYRTGMPQRLADAEAGLAWLVGRAEGLPLVAVGHSEGAYHAARLAGDNRGVAGAVLLSGSVRTGSEVLAWQTAQLASRLPPSARLILRLMRTDAVRAQRKNMDKVLASTDDVMRVQGTKINARWFRDFAAYDPAPALARITVPVLAITGGQDVQVPPDDVEAMGRLVRGPFEGHVAGDLSHLLRPDPDSVGPRGYFRSVREPVSPEVLGLITAWTGQHWPAAAPEHAAGEHAAGGPA
jgi:pimeloyl-ACP methyl ester carboxylesterase